MNQLTFTPAPGTAPTSRRILRHGLTEAKLMIRNGEQLLLALVIPAAILIGTRVIAIPVLGNDLPSSVLALAVWSTAFTSIAISTGFERRYGVLERLAATPLGRTGLVAGKALAVVLMTLGQLVILSAIAVTVGWRPGFSAGSLLTAVLAVALAIVCFVSFAMILAGRLRAEANLALANVIYLIGLLAGGLVVPTDRFGAIGGRIVGLLPTGALGDALRGAARGVVAGWPLLVLAVWAIVLVVLARKAFRWIS